MICCENVVNVAFLQKKEKKKKSNTQKNLQYFSQQLSWQTFTSSYLSLLLTHFYLPLSICHINKYEKFWQIFCVYKFSIKKKKNYMWFMLISNFFESKTRK